MANTIHIHEIPQELDPMEMDGSELLVVSNPDSEMNNYETNKLSINKLSQFVNRDGGSSSGGLSFDQIYPVDSIYITVSSTFNPNEVFEGTTWTVIGNGRCLWGCANNPTDVGKTLNGIFPKHYHEYYDETTEIWEQFDSHGSTSGTQKPAITKHEKYLAETRNTTSSVSGIDAGNTLRPPSIGVIFWRRTA